MNESFAEVEEQSDYTGGKLGMWLFIFSEIILFGVLFLLYAVYRSNNVADFHNAALEMNTLIGTVNTAILLTSSLFVALSIHAIQKEQKGLAEFFLSATIIFGAAFLVIKSFEWLAHFHHGMYPNSPELLNKNKGTIMFFSLYYVMTGLHGLHVFIGVIVLSVMLLLVHYGKINKSNFTILENTGLYWHLVDIIWIFLFPLFYLIT